MTTPPAPPAQTAPTAPTAPLAYEPAPPGSPADAPRVFSVIQAVMRDTVPVGKDQRNEQQRYRFRGIDDVMSAMAGPMRTHGLIIVPSLDEHLQERRGEKMTHTVIRMRYRIYGPAGDALVATVPGEASDFADKATNKAMSAALKYLLFQVFMIPVDGRSIEDGDRHHPEPPAEHRTEQAERAEQAGRQRRERREPDARQAGPQRDYLADAEQADTPARFAAVRAAAVTAGAPAGYLARLDAVGARKRSAAPGHAAALGDLYDAARTAGLVDRAEAEQTFANRYGTPPASGTVAQLRELTDDLLDAAGVA
ncbi:ERF family protein [Streptomyces sp. NPDC085524]|uniref:ERF family protein n=1 Tax=unclassified Streptomyces TaxID=2593676 RepID=UPI0035DA839D